MLSPVSELVGFTVVLECIEIVTWESVQKSRIQARTQVAEQN